MAGVIPIIFAVSLVLFHQWLPSFFVNARSAWLAALAVKIIALFQNQIFTVLFISCWYSSLLIFIPQLFFILKKLLKIYKDKVVLFPVFVPVKKLKNI